MCVCVELQWIADKGAKVENLMGLEENDGHEVQEGKWHAYLDDRTWKPLRPDDVRRARKKEIQIFLDMRTYVKVPWAIAIRRGFKEIQAR